MDAIIVVDMQNGLRNGPPKHDLSGVLSHINQMTAMVRRRRGQVIWIQHRGGAGDDFAPGTPGWELLPELNREAADLVIPKTLNDAFSGTDLQPLLARMAPDRVLIAGWATDFCVDATVRSAVSHDHHVRVISDGHTLSDRPHLDAASVIRHHNWVWSNLITHRSIRVANADELLEEASR
jgi:nicotinamidase-related amidase